MTEQDIELLTVSDLAAFLRDRICINDTKLDSAYADRVAGEILEKWPGLASAGAEQGAKCDTVFVERMADAKRWNWTDGEEDRLIALARRATAPTSQREEGFRACAWERFGRATLARAWEAGDMDGTEIAEEAQKFGIVEQVVYDPEKHGDLDADTGDMIFRTKEEFREAASPAPDLTTPYVPRVVDMPDGYSELVLLDALIVWDPPDANGVEIGYAASDDEEYRFITRVGVRWPTRALPAAPAAKPSPFDGHCCTPREGEPFFVLLGRDKQAPAVVEKWAAAREAAKPGDDKIAGARDIAAAMRAYSGAPSAPPSRVPVGEVTEEMVEAWAKRWWGPEVYLLDHEDNRAEAREALRAALAPAVEVTEAMVTALKEEMEKHNDRVGWTSCYSALRAALAAGETRA